MSWLRRRDVLRGLGLAAGTAPLGAPGYSADEDLSITITIGERTLRYAASAGRDLGDYRAASFTQRCIRTEIPGVPLTVFFRPDRTSERIEIIVELGRLWGEANAAAAHLGAYRAVVRKGERQLADIKVPRHWWFARWRWQSSPRPLLRTPAQLLAAGLVPPYSAAAATFAEPAHDGVPAEFRGPMDDGGLQTRVGTAGERIELGPLTEYQADYLITGRASSLASLRAHAEAAASMPMHMRDEITGAPIDLFQYPGADWYYTDTGYPWIRSSQSIRDAQGRVTCEWVLDSAHDPALNYVPYLLTDDPYHLEELQFQANQTLGWTSYHRSQNKLQIVFPGETRSFAWSIRSMFQLAAVMPDAAPGWFLPRGYWKRVLADNLSWLTQHYVDNPSPACAVFNAGTIVADIAAWQEEFMAFCLGWGVLLGFEDWRKAFRWKLGATLARTNGKSGWPRQWCTPYYYRVARGDLKDGLYASASPDDVWLANWQDAWEFFRADPENEVDRPFPADKTVWAQHNSVDYLIYTRGVLALAAHLGVAEAREPFAFVDRMARQKRYMTYKWAVAPNPS